MRLFSAYDVLPPKQTPQLIPKASTASEKTRIKIPIQKVTTPWTPPRAWDKELYTDETFFPHAVNDTIGPTSGGSVRFVANTALSDTYKFELISRPGLQTPHLESTLKKSARKSRSRKSQVSPKKRRKSDVKSIVLSTLGKMVVRKKSKVQLRFISDVSKSRLYVQKSRQPSRARTGTTFNVVKTLLGSILKEKIPLPVALAPSTSHPPHHHHHGPDPPPESLLAEGQLPVIGAGKKFVWPFQTTFKSSSFFEKPKVGSQPGSKLLSSLFETPKAIGSQTERRLAAQGIKVDPQSYSKSFRFPVLPVLPTSQRAKVLHPYKNPKHADVIHRPIATPRNKYPLVHLQNGTPPSPIRLHTTSKPKRAPYRRKLKSAHVGRVWLITIPGRSQRLLKRSKENLRVYPYDTENAAQISRIRYKREPTRLPPRKFPLDRHKQFRYTARFLKRERKQIKFGVIVPGQQVNEHTIPIAGCGKFSKTDVKDLRLRYRTTPLPEEEEIPPPPIPISEIDRPRNPTDMSIYDRDDVLHGYRAVLPQILSMNLDEMVQQVARIHKSTQQRPKKVPKITTQSIVKVGLNVSPLVEPKTSLPALKPKHMNAVAHHPAFTGYTFETQTLPPLCSNPVVEHDDVSEELVGTHSDMVPHLPKKTNKIPRLWGLKKPKVEKTKSVPVLKVVSDASTWPSYVPQLVQGFLNVEKSVKTIQRFWRSRKAKDSQLPTLSACLILQRLVRARFCHDQFQKTRKLLRGSPEFTESFDTLEHKLSRVEQTQSHFQFNATNHLETHEMTDVILSPYQWLSLHQIRVNESLPDLYFMVPSTRRQVWDLFCLLKERVYSQYQIPSYYRPVFPVKSVIGSLQSVFESPRGSIPDLESFNASKRVSIQMKRMSLQVDPFASKRPSLQVDSLFSKRPSMQGSDVGSSTRLEKDLNPSTKGSKVSLKVSQLLNESVRQDTVSTPEDVIDLVQKFKPMLIPAHRRSSILMSPRRL